MELYYTVKLIILGYLFLGYRVNGVVSPQKIEKQKQ